MDDAMNAIMMDPDVAAYAGHAATRLNLLVARQAMPGEEDDMPLIVENLRYDPQMPDGSHADYVVNHIQAAYDGIPVKSHNRARLERETRQHIIETALDPNRELRNLGLEPVRPGEHVEGTTTRLRRGGRRTPLRSRMERHPDQTGPICCGNGGTSESVGR